jgi:glucosyl-dolichyl phosphate glucuronosyltransferase
VRVSLVVPTCNRASFLSKSLPSFFKQTISKENYEIIIIDNNSVDNTREVSFQLIKQANCLCRYIFEPNIGLHYARNRGILEAQGDIVVFGDDDIIATPEWLENILIEFDTNHLAGVVGGKIKPLWEKEPVDWVYDYGSEKIHAVFAYLDYGDGRMVLSNEYLFGNNMGIRKELAIKIGGSFPDVFPKKLRYLSGSGEIGMIESIRKLNYEVIYLPMAQVDHYIASSRLTLQYFIERYRRWAVEDAFYVFRSFGNDKMGAASQLINDAIHRLFTVKASSLTKINPKYFMAIEKRAAIQLIKQTIKVLLDESLYQHIIKPSYLEFYTKGHSNM